MPFLRLEISLYCLLAKFLIMHGYWILSMLFLYLLLFNPYFFLICALMWWIALTFKCYSQHILCVNPTWSFIHIIIFICCWIRFITFLLMIFIAMFVWDYWSVIFYISVWFWFQVFFASKLNLGNDLSPLFPQILCVEWYYLLFP